MNHQQGFDPRQQAQTARMPRGVGLDLSASTVEYLQQVYAYLGASMLLAVAAGYVGMDSPLAMMARQSLLISLVVMIGTMMLAFWKPGAPTLFLATGSWGFLAGPIIGMYVNAGAAGIVGQAAFLTGAIFVGMTAYAMTTKKDFSFMGGMLFAGLIVIIVGGLVNAFFLKSPAMTFAISAGGALLMSGFLLYETQQLKQAPWAMHPAAAAVSLFTTIYNLFMMLLSLLGMGRDE
uniref:Uncharacterized protein n=1 Tax=Magnetococcus massalia (strain MO-1) TaxID=451514 RepID=A0A1S7LMQ7_MAGMO|nr:Conserved membrane protein of unknown function [Candidatus Magnetococcus massalia]